MDFEKGRGTSKHDLSEDHGAICTYYTEGVGEIVFWHGRSREDFIKD